jgi:uncharacterized membrane protein
MKRGDGGQVLVIVAIASVVFLGFAALAIDVAYMFTLRNELQRCADSGALAGASRFTEPGGIWTPDVNAPVMIEAAARARDYATKDTVGNARLNPVSEVLVGFPADNQVRVDVSRNAALFFAGVFGVSNRTLNASAVARSAYSPGPPVDNIVQLVK